MTLIPYPLSRRLLVLFALLVFSLLVFHPRPETITAGDKQSFPSARTLTSPLAPKRSNVEVPSTNLVGRNSKTTPQGRIPIPIPRNGGGERKDQKKLADVTSKLSELGPIFPVAAFTMSNFSVEGFVKGKWPIVVVYELEADSTAEVTINSSDGKGKFAITLTPANGELMEVKQKLPEEFGNQPQLGVVSFRAFKNGPQPRKLARFFLYGLGIGDKAVGSMVVDQLKFQPSNIRPKLKEKASYSFHSLSDFDSGSVDLMRVTYPDNVYHFEPVARKKLKEGIGSNEWLTKDWDGKNDKGKISPGRHQFRVLVWRTLQSGGDWVSAFSKQVVKVE